MLITICCNIIKNHTIYFYIKYKIAEKGES